MKNRQLFLFYDHLIRKKHRYFRIVYGGPVTAHGWQLLYTDKKSNKIYLIYKEIQRDQVQSHI